MTEYIPPGPKEVQTRENSQDQPLTAALTFLDQINSTRRQEGSSPQTDSTVATHAGVTGAREKMLSGFNVVPDTGAAAPDHAAIADHIRNLDSDRFAVREEASRQLAQGDTDRWLQTAQRCVGRLDGESLGLADCYGMLRQTQQMLANPGITNDQRRQIETVRTRAQELCDDRFQNGDPTSRIRNR